MVLVSNAHKFIFFKTSKTAGTTAEMALEAACAPLGHVVQEKVETLISERGIVGSRMVPCVLPPQPALEPGKWCHHKSAAHIKRDIGERRFESYTKLTTIRNPFDRCVSVFHWMNRRLFTLISDFEQIKDMFGQFIKSMEWSTDRQTVFIDNRYIIDRVIRFEYLNADLKAVAHDLGFALSGMALPHTKSSAKTRKSYAVADYFDQASIEIVRSRMGWVFKRYPYPDHPGSKQVGLS